MKYHTVDAAGRPAAVLDVPAHLPGGAALPPGSFEPPPAAEPDRAVVQTAQGWRQVPAYAGIFHRPGDVRPDGSVEIGAAIWGDGELGRDPFAEGYTDVPPPSNLGPKDRITGFDAAKRKWTVVRESAAAKAERAAAEAAEKLAAERVAMSLTNVELSLALYKAGKITAEEAEAFAATGAVPQAMMTSIMQAMQAAGLSAEQQAEARIQLKGLMVYRRTAALVPIMGQALGMDAAALDRLFSGKSAQ